MSALSNNDRITFRLSGNQYLVLNELSEALGCPKALLVRSIILDFLVRNEEALERIITHYQETGERHLDGNDILYDDNDNPNIDY